jgi:hypothetical protein
MVKVTACSHSLSYLIYENCCSIDEGGEKKFYVLSNNKSTNDYKYSALQQVVLCTMVATTYLATYLV